MIDDFANQKWTWDHKLVDGNFFWSTMNRLYQSKMPSLTFSKRLRPVEPIGSRWLRCGSWPRFVLTQSEKASCSSIRICYRRGQKHERGWWWSSKEISTVMYRVGSAFRRSIWSTAERVQIFWPGESFFEGRNRILWLQFGTQLSTQKKNSVRKLNPFRVARFKFKTHVFKLVKG